MSQALLQAADTCLGNCFIIKKILTVDALTGFYKPFLKNSLFFYRLPYAVFREKSLS